MLEIRKNTFSKSYENTFFREFSRYLYNLFKEKNLSGVLIGSPFCEPNERLQIDALLITKNVVCIIDFKNFKGNIKLPNEQNFEFGIWTTDIGEQVKGGSSINPFIQLKNQRKRFYDVCEHHVSNNLIQGDYFNPARTIRGICFQENVQILGTIPAKDKNTFFITDKEKFLQDIFDIIDVTDKEVSLSEQSFDVFKRIFKADLYKIDEKPFEDVVSQSSKLDYDKLYDDQKAALAQIKMFFENPEQQIFVLQGTINSGKSFLIPFIQELAYNSQIQETEIFAASSRVAQNLLSANGIEKVKGIYSFIYGGRKSEAEEIATTREEKIDNEEQEISDELPLDIVPMKKSDNSENALFIVDEAQLISDSYHQSIDLVFGSGHLLKDFINFTDSNSTQRKIIFIGDPFQVQLGRTDKSPLNPAYLEQNYKLNVSSFQLLDKPDFSEINQQALNCVQAIKENLFNSLSFVEGKELAIVADEDKLSSVSSLITNNKDGHILSSTNEEAQKVNLWIKKSITKTGEDISEKDLVLFNNNISIENSTDPFAQPQKIYNGQFATVTMVGSVISEPFKIKGGKEVTLSFRDITLLLDEVGHSVNVLSFENYRLNPKAELSKEERISYKILLDKIAEREISNFKKGKYRADDKLKLLLDKYDEDTRKGITRLRKELQKRLCNIPSSNYYKFKNAAFLRFGWAMTVHKSVSYKWNEVLLNTGTDGGRTNENYFRWLYTGISRAKQKVNLINYKPITPFDNAEIRDRNTEIRPQEVFFYSENTNPELLLNELKEFVATKLYNFTIRSVEHLNWQERYFIANENNQEAVISFSYNAQGNFRFPTIIRDNNSLSTKIFETLNCKSELTNFEIVKDFWRKREYEKLRNALSLFKINIELIFQMKWKDRIRFFSGQNELEVEFDYGADGMISYITAKYYSDDTIWENFKKAVLTLK